MDKRKSFVLYTDYLEHIEHLNDDQTGKLFKAILSYTRDGKTPKFKGALAMAFSFIKVQLDRDAEKYDAVTEKRREAGKLGGRPKKTDKEKAKKANGFSEKQTKAKKPDNDNVNDTDTDTDTDNDNVNDNNIIYCSELETISEPTEPPIFSLPLNDNSVHMIFNADVIMWCELYPSVDIMQELRKMKGWLDANPKRRKTKSGIQRFVNGWLAKEQDKYKPPENLPESSNPFLNMIENERNIEL